MGCLLTVAVAGICFTGITWLPLCNDWNTVALLTAQGPGSTCAHQPGAPMMTIKLCDTHKSHVFRDDVPTHACASQRTQSPTRSRNTPEREQLTGSSISQPYLMAMPTHAATWPPHKQSIEKTTAASCQPPWPQSRQGRRAQRSKYTSPASQARYCSCPQNTATG